jgi:hypothetical protein
MSLVIHTGQCRNQHPVLPDKRCTLKSGHRGPCKLDLGPGALGVRTEQWLRAQPEITQDWWRTALGRGLTDAEREDLKNKVKAWHLARCEDPNTHTEIR